MSTERTVYIDQEPGFGDAAVIIANFVSQIIPTLFSGGGKQDAKRRDAKRKALSEIGFNWIPTSGVPLGQEWNIDNWPDVSLDNIAMAVAKHGQIVVQLHNQQKFNPGNTQTMQQIDQVVAAHGGGSSHPAWNQGYVNVSGSSTGGVSMLQMAFLGVATIGLIAMARGNKPVPARSTKKA